MPNLVNTLRHSSNFKKQAEMANRMGWMSYAKCSICPILELFQNEEGVEGSGVGDV